MNVVALVVSDIVLVVSEELVAVVSIIEVSNGLPSASVATTATLIVSPDSFVSIKVSPVHSVCC